MKSWLRGLSLSSFKGENVREYASTASDILTQLERDRQLPQTHLLRILDVFTSCSVMDFKIHWMGRRPAVQQFVRESAGKNEATVKAMVTYVHFDMLLDEGKALYVELQAQWGPATSVKSKEATMLATISQLSAKVAQLDQQLKQTKPEPKKDVKCYECGKPGFTKRTCPDCKKKREASTPAPAPAPSPAPAGNAGKWAKPKDGEPQEKMIDGKLHKFCRKCNRGKGRWVSGDNAHLTADHVDGFMKKKREQQNQSAGLAQDLFSAWRV